MRFHLPFTLLGLVPFFIGCATSLDTPESPTPTADSSPQASASPFPTGAVSPASSPSPPPTSVPSAGSLPDPSRVTWTVVHSGLSQPVDLQAVGADRLFFVEQPGRIRLAVGGQLQETPFLDLQHRVNSSFNEQGLLGLALHPDFADNGFFYVNYTGPGSDTFVSRFHANPLDATADPDSEFVLLTVEDPFPNHNGGGMVFGPDGYLYISSGDGGSAGDPFGNGQSLDTLLGKILRIDVDSASPYGIPPDNPFAAGGGRPEIWAYGLRNPWRFSFDSATADLYIGDVGQGLWEEINFQAAGSPGGENYGWNVREGAHPFAGDTTAGLVDPVAEYSHDSGCSVTGGVVVRDPVLPDWQGVYLYADYCSGIIWGLLRSSPSTWENDILFRTDYRITSFGIDAMGRVYVLDRRGRIAVLEPAP